MVSETNASGWLTAKRLRAHGVIFAVCFWSVCVWNLATPGLRDRNGNLKGTDFLHFYTLGSLAVEHRGADLYDMNAQARLAAQRVPEAAGIRYLPLYPPQVSLIFAPLAHLSYGWALIWWWGCSVGVYCACCFSMWRACSNLRDYGGTVVALAAGFPAFFHLIAWGQTSALALGCFTLAFFLMRARNNFLAGLALGCLIFKPQLGVAAAVVLLATGAWKIVAGGVLSALAQLWIGVLYYGWEPLQRWLSILRHAGSIVPLLEPRPYQTHSLRTFWTMLLPWPNVAFALYVATAVAVLILTIACWKRSSALELRFPMLLLATVLVAPHLTVYDLLILAPAFLLLADWLVAQLPSLSIRNLGTSLYLVYVLPLLDPFTRRTHVQLSVIAMAASVYVIWRLVKTSRTET